MNCISEINGTKIDNADRDVVMPMYNVLEYSKNYKKNNRKPVELEMNQIVVQIIIM